LVIAFAEIALLWNLFSWLSPAKWMHELLQVWRAVGRIIAALPRGTVAYGLAVRLPGIRFAPAV